MSQGGEWTCVSAKKKKSPSKAAVAAEQRRPERERGSGTRPPSAKDPASSKAASGAAPAPAPALAALKGGSKSNVKSSLSGGEPKAAAVHLPPAAIPPAAGPLPLPPFLPSPNNVWGKRQAAAAAASASLSPSASASSLSSSEAAAAAALSPSASSLSSSEAAAAAALSPSSSVPLLAEASAFEEVTSSVAAATLPSAAAAIPSDAAVVSPPSPAHDVAVLIQSSSISAPAPAPAPASAPASPAAPAPALAPAPAPEAMHSQCQSFELEVNEAAAAAAPVPVPVAEVEASSSSSSTAAAAPSAALPAPKSWASLVRAGSTNLPNQLKLSSQSASSAAPLSVQVADLSVGPPEALCPQTAPPVDAAKLQLQAIGTALCQCGRDLQRGKELGGLQLKIPRGLVNRGNMCFVNAVWQMLLLVPPLVHVLRAVITAANRHFSIGQPFPSSLPVLRSMCAFIATLDEAVAPAPFSPPRSKNKNKQLQQQQQQQHEPASSKGLPLDIPPPIAPEDLISSLSMFCPDDHVSIKGKSRQEDAHEYISWLLAAADDEMRAAMSLTLDTEPQAATAAHDAPAAEAAAAAALNSDVDGEWETVGKRSGGGGLVTQVISRSSTPLALIFSGSLATSVHRQGARGACSFSPFWFLAVDFAPDSAHDSTRPAQAMQGVSQAPALHLEELLAMSFKKNAVDTGEVSVSHVLQQLPKVLLLHVKRFALRDDKIVKISQPLQVAPLLQMKRAWMLGAQEQAQQQYRLAAAVLHHGQGLGRGHYTAVCKVNAQQWIHWDDSSHRLITEVEALHMAGEAYLLMFFLK